MGMVLSTRKAPTTGAFLRFVSFKPKNATSVVFFEAPLSYSKPLDLKFQVGGRKPNPQVRSI